MTLDPIVDRKQMAAGDTERFLKVETAQGEIHRWAQARTVQQGVEGSSTEEAVCVGEV